MNTDGNDPGVTLPVNLAEIVRTLAQKPQAWDLLRFLNEQVLREQEIYWQRFYAFATLHAGAFVLVTSNSIRYPKAIAIVGFALGIAWFYIQWLSLSYADRAKAHYHELRKALGIYWPHEASEAANVTVTGKTTPVVKLGFREKILRQKRISSTDIGLGVTGLVVICWVIAFFLLPA